MENSRDGRKKEIDRYFFVLKLKKMAIFAFFSIVVLGVVVLLFPVNGARVEGQFLGKTKKDELSFLSLIPRSSPAHYNPKIRYLCAVWLDEEQKGVWAHCDVDSPSSGTARLYRIDRFFGLVSSYYVVPNDTVGDDSNL